MKRLLLPLLAALALPTAVNAESVWLLINFNWDYDQGFAVAFEKIEMKDMEQCEEQAAIYMRSNTIYGVKRKRGYVCLKGK
tara:strand:- start:47 stop:289 length:243 start_codon:yes stop_codon:yes gene_type:complete